LGLCYYYLRRPEPALINLRGYLARTQSSIAAEDREDVERWIREMEALRAQSSVPTYQSGFLLVPYFGLQFPVQAAGWISSGLRVGALIGDLGGRGPELSLGRGRRLQRHEEHVRGRSDGGIALLKPSR